jgi:hypothetical protein
VELKFVGGRIAFDKIFSGLDKFVFGFTSVLDKQGVRYVLVSGYVSILFGRSRGSEDVDIILEKLDAERFAKLWKVISKKYECVNVTNMEDALENYLLSGLSVRFSEKGQFIPNMEVKFPKTALDRWTIAERREVKVNNKTTYISPMELQIPYKLFLGSEKDIEDAKHLYRIFKDTLDTVLINEFNAKLGVESLFREYMR